MSRDIFLKTAKLVAPFLKDFAFLFILLAVTLFIYSNLFSVSFIYDDYDFLFSWNSIHTFNHIPSLLLGETPIHHEGVYRPLRSLMYVLSYHFYHLNIFFYHLQELAIYFLCIMFV